MSLRRDMKLNTGKSVLLLAVMISCILTGCGRIREHEAENTKIEKLRVCHLENPMGIDEEIPTFSWQMVSEKRGAVQTAYQIFVADSAEALEKKQYLWDSGEVSDSLSVGIAYAGGALQPKSRYYWQVNVKDGEGKIYTSEISSFETGLMGQGMADAKWISAPALEAVYTYDDTSYRMQYDLEVTNGKASFIFGAGKGRYGSMYLCEVENRDESAYLKLRHMDNNVRTEVGEADILHCRNEENGSLFHVELQVEESSLTASVNGTQAGSFEIDKTPLGSIGYLMERTVAYAYMDNILVQDEAGNILYEEDFEGNETIFAPYYVKVEEGRMRMGSGWMLTKGYEDPAPLFRREFTLQDKALKSARVYMTSLGSFILSVNGQRATENYFDPGKLVYNRELSYVTYDVTGLLKPGEENVLGAVLLNSWYDKAVGYVDIWNPWGDTNALQGMLEITYQDDTVETIVTDGEFVYTLDGPVRDDDIYQGEYYDANHEKTGYDQPGYELDDTWHPAEENNILPEYFDLPLIGKKNEPITCVQKLMPVSVTEPVENVFVYDFGQNFTGTCRIKVKGEKGQIVTLRYAEALNDERLINKDDVTGTIWTENLLGAEATDYYVLKGDEQGEIFEPEFVFHGYRYLQITGLEEALLAEDVEGVVLSSNLEQSGTFESSNQALNRYYQNAVWSQRSNFLDNPMDCPQRDERHGWAGDAQLFSLTASYNMNTYAFMDKFLYEMRLLQGDEGSFPDMVSRNFATGWGGGGGPAGNNCWGDAPVVITWNLYCQYGDRSILEENYEALCVWVDYLEATSEEYIRYVNGYGDHLSRESTPEEVTNTAWCARSAYLVSCMAKILEKSEDAEKYGEIYENFKKAWQTHFVTPEGITTCDTQTSYVLGLYFGLFPEELQEAAKERLLLLAEYSGYHINTGYAAVNYILPVFSQMDREDIAYRMLLQTEYPSLLFLAENGATTTWESFYNYVPEGEQYYLGYSMNHYAFGSVAGWLYTDVLGIQSDANDPGYHHILLEPKVNEALSFAKGEYESMYGKIGSAWEKTENGYQYSFVIPANTTAELTLPIAAGGGYLESGIAVTEAEGVEVISEADGKVTYRLESGRYIFTEK